VNVAYAAVFKAGVRICLVFQAKTNLELIDRSLEKKNVFLLKLLNAAKVLMDDDDDDNGFKLIRGQKAKHYFLVILKASALVV